MPTAKRRPELRPEVVYIESSALLRVLLERDAGLQKRLRSFDSFFTSTLTLIEVPRALARARNEARISVRAYARARSRFAAFARGCTVSELTDVVRERAALEFPVEPVRTLDAIHLATIVTWADTLGPLIVASCDQRVSQNALALGYEVVSA